MKPTLCLFSSALGLLTLSACDDNAPIEDYGAICVESATSGSQYTLEVTANSMDCGSDHEGVAYSCEATLSGSAITVTTTYVPGSDPNSLCAPPVFATCSLTADAGSYTLSFAGEDVTLEVPAEGATCVPEGTEITDSGWL